MFAERDASGRGQWRPRTEFSEMAMAGLLDDGCRVMRAFLGGSHDLMSFSPAHTVHWCPSEPLKRTL